MWVAGQWGPNCRPTYSGGPQARNGAAVQHNRRFLHPGRAVSLVCFVLCSRIDVLMLCSVLISPEGLCPAPPSPPSPSPPPISHTSSLWNWFTILSLCVSCTELSRLPPRLIGRWQNLSRSLVTSAAPLFGSAMGSLSSFYFPSTNTTFFLFRFYTLVTVSKYQVTPSVVRFALDIAAPDIVLGQLQSDIDSNSTVRRAPAAPESGAVRALS